MLTCLLILAVTLFFLTLYSILQNNAKVFNIENSRFFSLKVLDTPSAATLFITLLGALLVRHQFAVGVLPRINYKSTKTERRNSQNSVGPFETWRVEIRNTGLGSAIIYNTQYVVKHVGAKSDFGCCTFEEIIKELDRIDLVRERDYWIEKITNGFSLSPKDVCFVFEIKIEHIEKLKSFEMVLYFQGQLGDKYRREIGLIPQL